MKAFSLTILNFGDVTSWLRRGRYYLMNVCFLEKEFWILDDYAMSSDKVEANRLISENIEKRIVLVAFDYRHNGGNWYVKRVKSLIQ